jgi:hypothetical protein
MVSYKGIVSAVLVFAALLLVFSSIGQADELILRYTDGSAQRIRLDRTADAIRQIEFVDERKPWSSNQLSPTAIRVVSGTYGGNCGAFYGNVTEHLASVCNGRPACEYIVDVRTLGDPARECSKDFVAEWRCGNSPERATASVPPEAGNGKRIVLRCPVR